MSQHSFSIPDESGAAFRADVNNALQALAQQSSGGSEPATRYSYQMWADETGGVFKQRNAGNSLWIVRGTLSGLLVVSRASNTVLGLGDYGKTFVATAGFTQTLTAAATLGDGWWCDYRIESGATVTFDPNASETIDGATTKAVTGPAGGTIRCDGSGFKTVAFDIGNDSVTYAKIQNVSATDKLLGRSTAGAGDVEEIACTAAGRALIAGADKFAQQTTLGIVVKRKTADESVTSSTTLQDDDHLTFPIAANEEWEGSVWVVVGGTLSVHGIKVALNAPSGAAGAIAGSIVTDNNVLVSGGSSGAGPGTAIINSATISGSTGILTFGFSIINGATPGNVTVQFAQGTSNGLGITFKKGSWLKSVRTA
jgi:hypothetical protein